MRRALVSLSLLGMLGATAGLGLSRPRPEPPDLDAEPTEEAAAPAAAADATSPGTPPGTPLATAATAPDAPVQLRIVAASWEVLAPGALANDGLEPGQASAFTKAGLDVHFTAAVDAADLETQLGLGGDVQGGADLALMSLPTFVASYERLRALSPQVFFVVGWSRGRDALTGDAMLLRKPPASGPVTLIGQAGSAPTLLALFALQAAGVSPARVQVVSPDGPTPKHAIRSLRRDKSRQIDAREVLLSTADATHLVALVAIAPKGVLTDKRAALTTWSHVWLEGTHTLAADPPAAARTLAGQAGAPKAVDLIDALGWVEFADLPEIAAAVGLSGRRAATLDALFSQTWTLWRDSGLIATPPPEHIPLDAVVIAELASAATGRGLALPPRPQPPTDSGRAPIVVHRVLGPTLGPRDEVALVREAGFLAEVFTRSPVRITVPRDPKAAARVGTNAAERFGLDPRRFIVVTKRTPWHGTAAMLEVLPAV